MCLFEIRIGRDGHVDRSHIIRRDGLLDGFIFHGAERFLVEDARRVDHEVYASLLLGHFRKRLHHVVEVAHVGVRCSARETVDVCPSFSQLVGRVEADAV